MSLMLEEWTLFGKIDKVKDAIQLIQENEPENGYYVSFSGGKDSTVILDLVKRAGVKYDAHYHDTTIDPPEIYQFLHDYHPNINIHQPDKPFLELISKKGFPIRQRLWCRQFLKANIKNEQNRTLIVGIRKSESMKRKLRKTIESNKYDETIHFLHPILHWKEIDVWEYIHKRQLPYCKLYDEGWTRIGCLFCPYASKEMKFHQVKRYPEITKAFIEAFEKAYEHKKSMGYRSVRHWNSGEEMFWWWISNGSADGKTEGQFKLAI